MGKGKRTLSIPHTKGSLKNASNPLLLYYIFFFLLHTHLRNSLLLSDTVENKENSIQ